MNAWEQGIPVDTLTTEIDGVAQPETPAWMQGEPVEQPPIAHGALDADPDAVARNRALAAASELPEAVVESNPAVVAQNLRRDEINKATAQNPALARVMADPDTAKIAHDDVEQLNEISTNAGTWFGLGKNTTKDLRAVADIGRSLLSGANRINEAAFGYVRAAGDVLGGVNDLLGLDSSAYNSLSEGAVWAGKGAAANSAMIAPDKATTDLHPWVQSGVESAGMMLAAIAGGNPALALPILAGAEGGSSYSEARDGGASVLKSLGSATTNAVAEYVTEMIPVGKLFKDLAADSGLGKMLLHQLATEIPGEQLATVWQDFNDWLLIHPDKTLSAFVAERPGRAAETLVSTIVAVGMLTGAAHGARAGARKLEDEGTRNARAAEAARQAVALIRASKASKTRMRSPEAVQALLTDSMASETGETPDFYIDGQAFAQSVGEEGLAQLAQSHPELAEQVTAAAEQGGDVVIPVADFVANFADTPLGETLTPHLRESVDAASGAEAQVFAQLDPQAFAQSVARIEASIDAHERAAQGEVSVRQTILQQLEAAGRFAPGVNASNATLAAAMIRTMGARQGLTAEQMHERMPLRVTDGSAPQTSAPAAPAATLNDRVAALTGERDAAGPDNDSPLTAALTAVTGFAPSDWGEAATWAMDNGRPDIAQVAAERAERLAAAVATGQPTLAPDAPGHAAQVQSLATQIEGAQEYARTVRAIAGPASAAAQSAALEQRAPTSDVGHRREKATGRYVGAPDWVGASSSQLGVLRRRLRGLADEGHAGQFWYEDSARAVMELVGNDPVEAEKFIALLAIYSQGTEVSANVTFALVAYYQYMAGLPIDSGRFPVAQSAKAEAILRRDEGWGGVKTNNFYNDLMEEIDPSKTDEEHATMDMWMALAFDYGSKILDQGPKYAFAKAEIVRLAGEMGVRPHQVQAMIWGSIKYRVESTAAKRSEIERANGIQVKNAKGLWKIAKGREVEHYRLAVKLAMEMDADQSEIDAAKFDFGDALRDRMVQISWEATPSTATGRSLPGIHSATIAQKFEYLAAMRETLTDEHGHDIINALVGLPQGRTVNGVSAWEGAVGAGAQTMFAVPSDGAQASRAIRELPREKLDLAAAIRGFVLEQDAVVYHTPVFDDAAIRHNGYDIKTVRPLTPEEVQMLYSALEARFGTQELAPGWTERGARVLNFFEGLDNADFQKGMTEVMASLPDDFGGGSVKVDAFRSDGAHISNDWTENPNGESYIRSVREGRPDLLGRVADLRARAETVNAVFAAKYGWGDVASFGVGGDERLGDGRPVQAPTPTGSSPVSGTHFSRARRATLDGRYYGTGIKGAEADRVLASEDTRLRSRVYFYLDNGQGVRPEAGVGAFAHAVALPTLYDAGHDSLKINSLRVVDPSTWETSLLEGGFHGYFTRSFGGSQQGVAVVIGPGSHGLKATAVEPNLAVAGAIEGQPPAPYTTALMSAEIKALDMEAVRAAAPSANLRMGTLTVAAEEAGAARAAAALQGVTLPDQSLGQPVYHGTPHTFNRFDLSKINTGEGAQVYGWGLYFADTREVAVSYRGRLSAPERSFTVDGVETPAGKYGTIDHVVLTALADNAPERVAALAEDYRRIGGETKAATLLARLDELQGASVEEHQRPGGALLRAEIPDEAVGRMLLWDAPLHQQHESVRAALAAAGFAVDRAAVARHTDDLAAALSTDEPTTVSPRPRNPTGAEIYGQLETRLGSDKAASEYLTSLGIPGNRYLDQGSRDKGGGTFNTVVWDESVVDQLNEQVESELAQQNGELRGTFTPASNTIALLEKANLTTFLHELGHFGLNLLVDSANQDGAPQQIVDDVRTILKWFGVADLQTWNAMTLEQQRVHHEKFAEAFETYLFEGRAPSAELSGAFSHFRAWMLNVYKSIAGMRIQLTDEVRSVFDKLLATDEQIADQQQLREMAPLFTDAVSAGMTPEQWLAYQKTGEEATTDAVDELQARSLRDMKWLSNAKSRELKKLQNAAKEIRKNVRAGVESEVDSIPVYAAIRFISTGTMADTDLTDGQRAAIDTMAGTETKLSLPMLRELYGDDPAAPWRHLKKALVAEEGGAHPDAVAAAFGFDSGDALVRAILDAEPHDAVVEARTDQQMLEEHADLSDDKAVERAAERAIHNDARVRFVATEMKALEDGMSVRERVGETTIRRGKHRGQKRALTVDGLVRAAAQHAGAIVGRTVIRKLNPVVHSRAAAAEAKLARAAMGKGDLATALARKRNQLLHEKTSRMMEEARAQFDKDRAYLGKFRNNRARGTIDAGYVEQIENLLQGINTTTDTNRRAAALESLRVWVKEQEAAGMPVALDEKLLGELQVKNVRDLTVEQMRGLVEQVKHIEHLGRLKKKLLTARDAREFDEIVDALVATVRENGGRVRAVPFNQHAPEYDVGRTVRHWLAEHRKLASLVRQMDGGEDGGVFWKTLIRGMNDAGNREASLIEHATVGLNKIFTPLLKMRGGLIGGKRLIKSAGFSMSRSDRIAVALNWGNKDNRQRVLNTLSQESVEEVFSMLTREEWTAVQAIWDHLNEYWPDIVGKQKRVTGYAPEKVEAAPFEVTLPDGSTMDMDGGYYPLVYDAEKSDRAGMNEEAANARDMAPGAYMRKMTRRGHTEARQEKVGMPLLWTLDPISSHLRQVIHDLSWHEWLIDGHRLLHDKSLSQAIRDHYGHEVLQTMRTTLNDIAAGELVAQTRVDKAALWARSVASTSTMGLSATVSLLQPFGLANSVARIGGKWVLVGMRNWAGNIARLEGASTKIGEKSEFMRLRAKTFNREIAEIMGRAQFGRSTTVQAFQKALFVPMQKMQLVADIPTWYGAYEKALAQGRDEAESVALADQAVLDSQGGGQIKDLAGVQHRSVLGKLLSIFYSYFSATWNMLEESRGRMVRLKNPAAIAGWMSSMALLLVIPATLPEIVKEAIRGGDDDDDDMEAWLLRRLQDIGGFGLGYIVVLRELSGVVQGFGYNGPAFARVIKDVGSTLTEGYKQATDEDAEFDDKAFFKLMRGIFTAIGLPTTQIERSYRGWVAWEEGDAGPGSVLMGPPPKQ